MVRQVSSGSVQPLRIAKHSHSSSSSATAPASSSSKMASPRPLAEIANSSPRRNSPSYNQATRKMIVSRESSPFGDKAATDRSSPFSENTSPRPLWSARDTMSHIRFDENNPDRSPSPSLSPTRRESMEKLKQAGRVKNSNIFALETKDAYDPTTLPIVERPSANRPLSQQFVNNSFSRFDSQRNENSPRSPQRLGHKRSETEVHIPFMSPTRMAAAVPLPASPEKSVSQMSSPSPTKSSIARNSMFGLSPQASFDPENGVWSDDEQQRASTPRQERPTLHRHHKSVTFHEDPPTVNEYEQQTPEPSVSVGSREGSWDSDDFADQDVSFDRGSSAELAHEALDDSFDQDLENADKTPVVLPEDWRRMSPDEARRDLVNDEDDVFDGASPSPQRAQAHRSPFRPQLGRSESVNSNGEARPLPPLPAFMTTQTERPTSSASDETEHGVPQQEEMVITNLDTGEKVDVPVPAAQQQENEDEEADDVAGDLADFASPPRISRESILRKVRGTKYDFEDEDEEDEQSVLADSSPARPSYQDMAMMGPDEAVPSREHSRETSETHLARHTLPEHEQGVAEEEGEVVIKAEPVEDGEGIDLKSIPEIGDVQPPRSPTRMGDDYDRQSSVLRHDVRGPSSSSSADEDEEVDEDASRYSDLEPEDESTRLQANDLDGHDDGKETLDDAMQLLSVKDYSEAIAPSREEGPAEKPMASALSGIMGMLPTFLTSASAPSQDEKAPVEKKPAGSTATAFMGLLPTYRTEDGEYDFGMSQYITPSPPASSDASKGFDLSAAPVLQPSAEFKPPMEARYTAAPAAEVSPPDSPDSVIHSRTSEVSSLHMPEEELQGFTHSWEPTPEPTSTLAAHRSLRPEEEPQLTHSWEPTPEPSMLPETPIVPDIPERRSTIKTGGRLKARPSATPADFEAMAVQRRIVSSEYPPIPPVPSAYRTDAELTALETTDGSIYSSGGSDATEVEAAVVEEGKPEKSRRESRRMRMIDIPSLDASRADDLSLGLDEEFDRVIEGQKKGYLMRQNTKVVVASNRNFSGASDGTATSKSSAELPPMSPSAEGRPSSAARKARSANSSPRKPSAEQFLTKEPWNGTTRRKSVRNASAQKAVYAPAPPLPGQESALGVVDEDFAAGTSSLEEEVAEGVERGRLFVKVVGVKDLELPMPRNDRIYFQLTLDNGLHCVTTTSLELGKNAPIGQEFELVVLNDLEFQLTLSTQLPPPPAAPTPVPSSPTKNARNAKSTGLVSRLLSSPRKRAERERQDRELAEAEDRRLQEEAQRKQRASQRPASTWDLLHDLVNAADGSFARAYINLKAHEPACFGRQLTVDVPCYNEWAQEKDAAVVNSVRSKRAAHHGTGAQIRRPPYVVGKLELQLLYVPKPKGAGEEAMPKSMGSAVREMAKAAADVKVEVEYEGCLSQQGGDCQHWRRRFFRLRGGRLTAYHEHTHQKRAVINLAKASRLVDDKGSLVADPTSGNPGKAKGRRKSAFAEEDEGYQYVEEGFRVRFANGETIDFYADSRAEKERWMEALSQVVGKAHSDSKKDGKGARWTDLVLAREKAAGEGAAASAAASAAADSSSSPTATVISDTSSSPSKAAQRPSSPTKNLAGETAVKDFSNTRPAVAQRRQSDHSSKSLDFPASNKSVPNSPVKSAPSGPPSQRAPPLPQAAARTRPQTPPLAPRRGHRARDAVKSMIF